MLRLVKLKRVPSSSTSPEVAGLVDEQENTKLGVFVTRDERNICDTPLQYQVL